MMGFLAMAPGAFGAHGLNDVLTQNGTLAIWEKAVFYHLVHTVMLFVLALRRPVPIFKATGFTLTIPTPPSPTGMTHCGA